MEFFREHLHHFKLEHELQRFYDVAKHRWVESNDEARDSKIDIRGLQDFELQYEKGLKIAVRRVFHKNMGEHKEVNLTEFTVKAPLNPHDNPASRPNPLLEGVRRIVLVVPSTKKEGLLAKGRDFLEATVEWQTPAQAAKGDWQDYIEAPIEQFSHTFSSVIHKLQQHPIGIVAYRGSAENPSPVVIR